MKEIEKLSVINAATKRRHTVALVTDFTYEDLARVDALWDQAKHAIMNEAEKQGKPASDYMRFDWRWEWRSTLAQPKEGRALYGMTKNGMVHGLVRLEPDTAILPDQKGACLLNVKMLMSAPWNRTADLHAVGIETVYKGIGQTLMRWAVVCSITAGCEGRLAAEPAGESDTFYTDVCGMESTIKTPHDGPPTTWCEFTPHAAAKFIEQKYLRK